MTEENYHSDDENSKCGVYLSFLEGGVDLFVLLKLLQLGLDQNLSDVHHLLHRQSQTLHRVAELLLEGKHLHISKLPIHMQIRKTAQQQEVMVSADTHCTPLNQKTKHGMRW